MKLRELIKLANAAYPDDCIIRNFDERRGGLSDKSTGDMLARFICSELCRTYDPKAPKEYQLGTAISVMTTAHEELGRVLAALRPPVPTNSGRPLSNRTYAVMRGRLSAAHKTGNPAIVAGVAQKALDRFAETMYPDDWRIWQNALDEAKRKLAMSRRLSS